jgi:methylated-DNA-[protein]-cysteine S-methyltransferase
VKANSNRVTAVVLTPLGWAGVAVTEQGVSRVVLPRKSERQTEREIRTTERVQAAGSKLLTRAVKTLLDYFAGRRVSFSLPLDLHCSTAFQQAVWKAAASIPHGETRSYAWIAKRIKRPRAARAVGQALGANPIPLLIP